MKLSDYHKTHGLYGTLRSPQTGTELHFGFDPDKTRATVTLDAGGHQVEGYLELVKRHGIADDEELDMTVALRMGPRPDEDYKPAPSAVLGSKAKVAVPIDPRFQPGPAPDLNPLPARKAVELPRAPVDRFDPGPPPEGLEEFPEARAFVPSTEIDEDEAGPSAVEQAMTAEFNPPAVVKEAKEEAKKEGKEGRDSKKNVRR